LKLLALGIEVTCPLTDAPSAVDQEQLKELMPVTHES